MDPIDRRWQAFLARLQLNHVYFAAVDQNLLSLGGFLFKLK